MNSNTPIRIFFLSLAILLTPTLFSANIIFDLGGVLLEPNKTAIVMKAGPLSLAWYSISHLENPRTAFFNILSEIDSYTEPNNDIQTLDENGVPIPKIMCDWLKGIPSKKILGKIKKTMSTEHSLWPLATAIFDPQSMASTQKIIESGKKFVEECIEQGHCVYIISNWDLESFTFMQEQYPEFFCLFSGIVISGDCGLLKPDPEIYKHFLLEYKLDPKTCFFIDNQPENVLAAGKLGITGSVVQTKLSGNPDFKKVQKELRNWDRKIFT